VGSVPERRWTWIKFIEGLQYLQVLCSISTGSLEVNFRRPSAALFKVVISFATDVRPAQRKMDTMGNGLDRPPAARSTWAGVASQLLDTASES
jgi:hypothetical protein